MGVHGTGNYKQLQKASLAFCIIGTFVLGLDLYAVVLVRKILVHIAIFYFYASFFLFRSFLMWGGAQFWMYFFSGERVLF
jgi:hypothetical protein